MKTKYVLLGLSIIYVVLSIVSAAKGGDFDVFLDAAEKLRHHQNVYVPPFVKGLQYYYSPLFALLLIPFSYNFFISELIWLLFSGFLLYRIHVLITNYLDFSIFKQRDRILMASVSIFLLLSTILYNITMIQMTPFLLWASLESIQLIQNQKTIKGSMLLAFAINIKLMPVVILPYLIYRQYFKASTLVVLFIGIYLMVPSLFIGYDFNRFLLSEWWQVINPLKGEHLIEAGTRAQSFVGMIPVFLTETKGQIDISRNLVSLSPELAVTITNVVRVVFVLLTVFFLKSPFTKRVDPLNELRAIGYICLLVPMIFPHQQKYAFLFLYPMIVYLTYNCIVLWKYDWNLRSKCFVFSLMAISLLFSPIVGSDVIGRRIYDLIFHFRLVGIAVLFLILFAALSSPRKIQQMVLNQGSAS